MTRVELTDSNLTSDLDLAFDGAEDILRAWRRGMRPDPDLTVSEWADQNRWLSSRASAEPGRYRTARTPYLRAIMDALSPGHPAQRISFMKAAQVGATEAGNNWIGFVIHHAPGPMLAVLPTVEMAKRTSRGRIDPLIADSPTLKERVQPARSRDAGNSMLSKEFPGGILVLTGANSATGLRSMPARYVFLDEVDAYPASADEEGDPVTLAEARTTTFAHRRKVFMVSTPTIRGLSRIEREFEASDQQRYFVPCPHCGAMQWLQFERLRWAKGSLSRQRIIAKGATRPLPSTTRRRCWTRANGGRPRYLPTRPRSDSTSPLFIRRLAGRVGSRSRGTGWPHRARTRCCARRATRSWARPGSRAARPRTASGWRIGVWPSRRKSRQAGCS
tara:strand:+ start:28 stop:1194 length:1167 start_codon:yes stop_codon:yes gene_type:complete